MEGQKEQAQCDKCLSDMIMEVSLLGMSLLNDDNVIISVSLRAIGEYQLYAQYLSQHSGEGEVALLTLTKTAFYLA